MPTITTKELGASGTSKYGGVFDVEYNSDLKFPKSIDIYDQMRKGDATVKAALLSVKLPIRAANYFFEPASEDKKDLDILEKCEEQFFRKTKIINIVEDMCTALDFGFSIFEKVYEIKDGMVFFKKIAPRVQDSIISWETNSGEDGICQQAMKEGTWQLIDIPMSKLFIFSFEKEGDNLEGVSILRAAYKHWYYKENAYKIEAIAAERNGVGVPVVRVNKTLTSEEEDEILLILRNLRANEDACIIEKGGDDVQFRFESPNGQFDFEKFILHHDRQIVKSVLAQFLELGVTKGAMSLSDSHSNLFYQSLDSIADKIVEALQTLVDEFVLLNYGTGVEAPTLKHSDIGERSFNDFSLALERLSKAGLITPDESTEEYIRKLLDLPEREEMEEDEEEIPVEEKIVQKKEEIEVPEEVEQEIEKKNPEKLADKFEPFRPLTLAEQKVDFTKMAKILDKSEEEVKKIFEKHTKKIQKAILEAAKEYVDSKGSVNLFTASFLKSVSQELKTDLQKKLLESYELGKTEATREVDGKRFATPQEDKVIIREQARILSEKHASDLANEAVLSAQNGLRGIAESAAILAGIKESLSKKAESQIPTAARVSTNGVINQGIGKVHEVFADKIWGFQYSAILDSKTTDICKGLDGKVTRKREQMPQPPLHMNCRSRIVAILNDQAEKPEVNAPTKEDRDRIPPSFFDNSCNCGIHSI